MHIVLHMWALSISITFQLNANGKLLSNYWVYQHIAVGVHMTLTNSVKLSLSTYMTVISW